MCCYTEAYKNGVSGGKTATCMENAFYFSRIDG